MPTNKKYDFSRGLLVTCTYPASPASGGPVLYGTMTGVALKTKDSAGQTVVDFSSGVWALNVTTSGAIAAGDPLFLDAAAAVLSNDSTGYFFGFAMKAIASGAAIINVLHVESPGASTLGSGTVSTTNLAVGVLAASAAGRGKVAANFFDVATVLAKFATDSIANAALIQVIADGSFQADAPTRALFASGIWTGASLATGILKVTLAAGTAGGVNVTVAGMSAADEIASVLSFTTAASIASVADRTAEYAAGAGVATKAAGTNETNNQLVIIWLLKH
jgi:predicted RecA/RadA family phage recombinase